MGWQAARPYTYTGAPDNGTWIPERGLGDTDGISVTLTLADVKMLIKSKSTLYRYSIRCIYSVYLVNIFRIYIADISIERLLDEMSNLQNPEKSPHQNGHEEQMYIIYKSNTVYIAYILGIYRIHTVYIWLTSVERLLDEMPNLQNPEKRPHQNGHDANIHYI